MMPLFKTTALEPSFRVRVEGKRPHGAHQQATLLSALGLVQTQLANSFALPFLRFDLENVAPNLTDHSMRNSTLP